MIGINRFSHPCMPKELHQTYDLLKLQEKQDEKEKENKKNNDEIKVELKKVDLKVDLKVELSSNKADQISIKTDTKLDITA